MFDDDFTALSETTEQLHNDLGDAVLSDIRVAWDAAKDLVWGKLLEESRLAINEASLMTNDLFTKNQLIGKAGAFLDAARLVRNML